MEVPQPIKTLSRVMLEITGQRDFNELFPSPGLMGSYVYIMRRLKWAQDLQEMTVIPLDYAHAHGRWERPGWKDLKTS